MPDVVLGQLLTGPPTIPVHTGVFVHLVIIYFDTERIINAESVVENVNNLIFKSIIHARYSLIFMSSSYDSTSQEITI